MIKAEGVLSLILRDGPLSNFCRFSAAEADIRGDIDRVFRFDLGRPPEAMGTAPENSRHGQCVARGDKHDGAVGKNDNRTHTHASMHQDVRLPGSVPIPGYSRQAEAYGLGPMNPRLFPVVLGAIFIAGMDRFTPLVGSHRLRGTPVHGCWSATNLFDPKHATRTRRGGDSLSLPSACTRVHPRGFAPPYVQGMSGPQTASLDPVQFAAYTYMQPALMGMPVPPGHMFARPYLSPSPSSHSPTLDT
jgi:hypothetical protein